MKFVLNIKMNKKNAPYSAFNKLHELGARWYILK
jgi:hypothetical protein